MAVGCADPDSAMRSFQNWQFNRTGSNIPDANRRRLNISGEWTSWSSRNIEVWVHVKNGGERYFNRIWSASVFQRSQWECTCPVKYANYAIDQMRPTRTGWISLGGLIRSPKTSTYGRHSRRLPITCVGYFKKFRVPSELFKLKWRHALW